MSASRRIAGRFEIRDLESDLLGLASLCSLALCTPLVGLLLFIGPLSATRPRRTPRLVS